MLTAQRSAALEMTGWATGTVHQVLPGLTSSVAWRAFAAGWDRLPAGEAVSLACEGNPVLQALLPALGLVRGDAGDGRSSGVGGGSDLPRLIRCRQSRTTARPGAPGWPPAAARPAGYTVILLVSRTGVVGGTDIVQRDDGAGARLLLTRPGQYLAVDTSRVTHRVGPIALGGPPTGAIGHRDVLMIEVGGP
jgi:hypothetical protein